MVRGWCETRVQLVAVNEPVVQKMRSEISFFRAEGWKKSPEDLQLFEDASEGQARLEVDATSKMRYVTVAWGITA